MLCRTNHHKQKMPRDKTEAKRSITIHNAFNRDTGIEKGRSETNGFSKCSERRGIFNNRDKSDLIHTLVYLFFMSQYQSFRMYFWC